MVFDVTRAPIFAAISACLMMSTSARAEPIGSAIAVKSEVTAGGAAPSDPRRKLQKNDPVSQNEVIEVSADGLGELQFKDDTKLALGPNSRMALDKFVYDPAKSNGSIVVNLVKGTFRFVTGLAAKPTYEIKTPTASISVRGTVFDICIRPNGATWVLLIEGSVKMCAKKGRCRILREPGKVMTVALDNKVKPAASWPDVPNKQSTSLETAFPFATLSPSFSGPSALSTDDILKGRLPKPPAPQTKRP